MPTQSIKPNENKSHIVQHNYHDYYQDTPPRNIDDTSASIVLQTEEQPTYKAFSGNKSKRCIPLRKFPINLHELLEQAHADGLSDIISWKIHGRAFAVHNTKEFGVRIMPLHFQQSKTRSFFRQLNLYGFLRITEGRDRGAYYHELFLRGMPFLAAQILRQKVKGTQVKGLPSPETEPDFYSMPFVRRTSSLTSMAISATPRLDSEGIILLSSSCHPGYNPKNNIVTSTNLFHLPHTEEILHDSKTTDCGQNSSVLDAHGKNTIHGGGGLGKVVFDMIPYESSLSDVSIFDDENSYMSMLRIPNIPAELITNASDTLVELTLQEEEDLHDESMQFYSWQECTLLRALLQDTSA